MAQLYNACSNGTTGLVDGQGSTAKQTSSDVNQNGST